MRAALIQTEGFVVSVGEGGFLNFEQNFLLMVVDFLLINFFSVCV